MRHKAVSILIFLYLRALMLADPSRHVSPMAHPALEPSDTHPSVKISTCLCNKHIQSISKPSLKRLLLDRSTADHLPDVGLEEILPFAADSNPGLNE